jgi:hypothetical protein
MNTYVFNEAGECTCVANVELDLESFGDGFTGVHSESTYKASEIYYDGEIRPIKSFELVISTNLVTGIPVGTKAFIGNDMQIVDDGSLELEVTFKSVVTVVLVHPQYQTTSVEVSCEI